MSNPSVKKNLHIVRWVVLWGIAFMLSVLLYNYSYPYTKDLLIYTLQVKPAAWVLQLTLPELGVWHRDHVIYGGEHTLRVMRGCDGIEAWLLMITAIVFFPTRWTRKVRNIVYGSVLIFTLNYIRIITLFHILLFYPEWMDLAHGLIWQSMMVLAAVVFVLIVMKPDELSEPPKGDQST